MKEMEEKGAIQRRERNEKTGREQHVTCKC